MHHVGHHKAKKPLKISAKIKSQILVGRELIGNSFSSLAAADAAGSRARIINMPFLTNIPKFEDIDTEVITQFVSDSMGGGEPGRAPFADQALRGAYRLDRADVGVLAVKQPPVDIWPVIMTATLTTHSSFVLARLFGQPSFDGEASFDLAVRSGGLIVFFRKLRMFIGEGEQIAFIPSQRRGTAVVWENDELQIADLAIGESERDEGFARAIRQMRSALIVYPLG